MATTVSTYNGYEILALCGTPASESIEFNEFRASLGDGFSHQTIYGAYCGLKSWSMGMKNLKGGSSDADIVTVDGVTVNTATYLWDLFIRSKTTGKPFIVKSPRNDQYYLAEFTDSRLTYDKLLTKLFNATLNFTQVRVPGVSVFNDAAVTGVYGRYRADTDNQFLFDEGPVGNHMTSTGTYSATGGSVENGHATAAINVGATNTGFVSKAASPRIYEVIFVMRMREATFSNYGGILTDDGTNSVALLTGDVGQTKFYNQALGANFEFRKNGILYAETNQQAPMNKLGIVHIRYKGGIVLTNFQIGKDRAFAGRFAEANFGELWLFNAPRLVSDSLELTEHLATYWKVT